MEDPQVAESHTQKVVIGLWQELLGKNADPSVDFIRSGGDSFRAAVLATRVLEETGSAVSYLDILSADNADALVRRIADTNHVG
jgi:hypothetical protein